MSFSSMQRRCIFTVTVARSRSYGDNHSVRGVIAGGQPQQRRAAAILECKLHNLPHSQSDAMYNGMEMIDAVERRHGRRPTCSLGSSALLGIIYSINSTVSLPSGAVCVVAAPPPPPPLLLLHDANRSRRAR